MEELVLHHRKKTRSLSAPARLVSLALAVKVRRPLKPHQANNFSRIGNRTIPSTIVSMSVKVLHNVYESNAATVKFENFESNCTRTKAILYFCRRRRSPIPNPVVHVITVSFIAVRNRDFRNILFVLQFWNNRCSAISLSLCKILYISTDSEQAF